MILVTGATGKIGRHVVERLVAEGAKVRALTRNPTTANLPTGVDVVSADASSANGFTDVLAGTKAVFVNAAAIGASVADFMNAAKTSGVNRLVMLSSLTVRDEGEQDYWLGAHHKAIEAVIENSGLEWTFLRCGGFATNTLAWAPMIRTDGVVRTVYGHAATALIAEHDIADAAVRTLLDEGHAQRKYVLTGQQSLTQIEQVQAIGRAINRSLQFEEIPAEAFRQAAIKRMPASAIDDLLRYFAEYGGRTAETAPDLEPLIQRRATTFDEWAVQHAADFR